MAPLPESHRLEEIHFQIVVHTAQAAGQIVEVWQLGNVDVQYEGMLPILARILHDFAAAGS